MAGKGSRIQVKGMEVKTLIPRILNFYFRTKEKIKDKSK
jgi:hypothetical protein